MKVYVINKNGHFLMPCKPSKARKLLRDGKAKVVKRTPFTIQLTWDCEENTQPITLGIDKGSKTTGFCGVGNGEILISGHINHRTDVSKKMTVRAANRRQRRSRLWYRTPRFLNRSSSKRSGRLPPSIKTNIDEVLRVVKKLPLPITSVIVEDVLIDIAKLNNPQLQGKDYQQPNRLHENLRLATLLRDDFSCQQCKIKNTRLEAHHIQPKSQGGKETIKNLLTLCSACHTKLHAGKIKLKKSGVSGFNDQIAQRTMLGKRYLEQSLRHDYNFAKVYGYQTAYFRKQLGLEKDHDSDALAIATMKHGEKIDFHRHNFYMINFRAKQTRRLYRDLPVKGKGRVKYQVNKSSGGFSKGDIVLVKNKYVKQINSIYSNGSLAFKRQKGEPNSSGPQNCRLLERQSTMVFSSI